MPSRNQGFTIRMARPEDAQECHDIDVEAWGEDSAASAEQFRSRFTLYPPGNFVAVDPSGTLIGVVCTVATDAKPMTTWSNSCGDGTYQGVCNPYGDFVFGVNVSVRKACAGQGIGGTLVMHSVKVAWDLGKRQFQLGSRIPHYHKWQKVFRPEDYIRLSRKATDVYFQGEDGTLRRGPDLAVLKALREKGDERLNPQEWPEAKAPVRLDAFDGELDFFLKMRVAGQACRLLGLLPGYFPDLPSCDNGALVGWENLAYSPPSKEADANPSYEEDAALFETEGSGPYPEEK